MQLTKIEKVDADGFKEVYHIDAQGRKQGKYISYRPDGSKYLECNYKDDEKHGKYIAYEPDASRWLECNYKYGIRHGKCIQYYKNGIKREDNVSKDGKILKSTLYNEKGQKVEERKYFYPEGDKE